MVRYMNDILDKTDNLISSIKNSSKYKKYIELRNKMRENEEIMEIISDIKSLQKELVKEQSIGNDISHIDEKIKEKLMFLESFPLYLEYSYLEEDLNIMFQLIKEIIQKHINDITN